MKLEVEKVVRRIKNDENKELKSLEFFFVLPGLPGFQNYNVGKHICIVADIWLSCMFEIQKISYGLKFQQ